MTDPVPSKDVVDILRAAARFAFPDEDRMRESTDWQAAEEIQRLREDLRRTESAHAVVMAENRHYKRERDAYRSLAGIGLNGTDEADELAKIDPPWERDAEAMRRRQARNLASMKAIADAVRAAQPPGDGQ